MSEILPTRLSPLPEHLGPLPCHLGPLPGCLGPPQDTRLPSLFWGSKPRGLGIPLTLDRGMGGGALADPLCAPSVTVVALERQQHVAQENLVPEHFYVEQSEGWDGGTWGEHPGVGMGVHGNSHGWGQGWGGPGWGDRYGDLDGGTMGTARVGDGSKQRGGGMGTGGIGDWGHGWVAAEGTHRNGGVYGGDVGTDRVGDRAV